ncbi:MAG: CheB methylesterase domain-containing protein [Planctomycetota bacterium]|jgi:two-component system chemotaxis response regulator CheB
MTDTINATVLDRRLRATLRHCVLVAASTGGPQALATALGSVAADFPLPIVVAQHMPSYCCDTLIEQLARSCRLPIRKAGLAQPLAGGAVWFPPDDHHVLIAGTKAGPQVRAARKPPVHGLRPAADVLFNSAAAVFGDGCIATVFTGLGVDGCEGARRLHAAGSAVFTQQVNTCVAGSMPRSVEAAGVSHGTFTPHNFGHLLQRMTHGST